MSQNTDANYVNLLNLKCIRERAVTFMQEIQLSPRRSTLHEMD